MPKELLTPLLISEVSTMPPTPSAGRVVAFAQDNVFKVIGGNGETTRTVKVGSDGEIEIDSGLTLGLAINATITANTNNLVVTDIEKAIVLRLNSTGNFDLTGLVPFNNTKAWMIFVVNVGTNNISFRDNSASSTAANRFLLGANKSVQPNEGIIFFYDPVSSRWRGGGLNI
jgi:hypothetical protein